jgi:hypothetical protein
LSSDASEQSYGRSRDEKITHIVGSLSYAERNARAF